MAPEAHDIEEPFIPSDWIGKKKEYLTDHLPIAVIAAKNAFAELALPRTSSELVYGESQLWFRDDEPATDISFLKHRSIPPTAVLDLLSRKSGQAWLNGKKSIADPRFNDGTDRFPLSTLTFWIEMSAVIQQQAGWKRSIQWLDNERKKSQDNDTAHVIDRACVELVTMGWNVPLTYGRQSISTLDLREFLGTVWLTTNNVDIMMEDLAERVASDPELADRVIVAPLAFTNAVLGARKGEYTKGKAQLLHRYESEIKEKKKEKIVFPANVGNYHWIAGVIDFPNNSIDFGDSMPNCFQPPVILIKGLQRWLQKQFSDNFPCNYDALEHGVQRDSFNCGVVMRNTCERALYPSTPLWIPRAAVRERLQHFLKYATKQVQEPKSKQSEARTIYCRPLLPLLISTKTAVRHAAKDDEVLCEHPAFVARVGHGDHNFRDMPNPKPSAREKITITDLLNPRDDSFDDGNESAPSIASSNTAESSAISDSDVLLGRARWDDDSSSTSGEGVQGSHHESDVSFATGSGADFTSVGGDFTDWDNTSGSGVGFGTSAAYESEGESTTFAFEPTVAEQTDTRSAMEVDVEETPIKPKKPSKQSSLLGFFKRTKPGKSKPESKKTAPSTGQKRHRSGTDDGASTSSSIPTKKKPKTERATSPLPHVGIARSSQAARALMDKLKSGELEVDEDRWEEFKQSVRTVDKRAEFLGDKDWQDMRSVRHSKCGSIIQVRQPYEVSRFRSHCENPAGCKKVKPGAHMSTLGKIYGSFKWSSQSSSKIAAPHPIVMKPCPGVTEDDIPNVQKYLQRTGALGGGSRSVFKIAMDRFQKAFSLLREKDQKEVRNVQYHEQKWRNDHAKLRIFSTACDKNVPAATPRTLPCPPCAMLLSRKSLKRALNKKGPAKPENYIYTNEQFRNQLLGEIYGRTIGLKDIIEQPNAKTTPCVRYAQGALSGKYNNEVFNGLVEAMVTKADKEERGVGMQNFKYAPAYDEFCNVLRINSPAAYRAFQEHLPGRSERSFRAKEAREPRFPMDISDRNFKLAAEHLQALKYDGPVNLSCDDTKLFPSFRLYWDKDKKSHFLVGGSDGPLRVADPDQVKGVIADAKAAKATKASIQIIRLWCLTIPVPGVTPIIIAALPIANDLKADILLKYLIQVINGLIDHNINVISYACDGTQTERSVQDMFVNQATQKIEHLIEDPHGKGPPLRIRIAVYRNHSICMIQDSKHALKTFRNNLFSGARLLVLGSYTAIYSRIREMAFADGSPLFRRDVEKMDRQDDNAATRLFSADTLKYLADHHPQYLGEIIYLFIFGELIDAYQNRSMCHADRVKLVLRARYFLDSWSSFLDLSEYPQSVYFLSREAVDIARFIIEGYLSLLFIHRDHLNGLFPLLPWLHSSEACEHVFGEARHIVKDFTMLDFLYMIPKLRAAVLSAKTSNPKDRAAGYSHTYFDATGLDILALSTFPDDDTINDVALEAAEEADSLIALLGLAPAQLHRGGNPASPMLPSIAAWYPPTKDDCDADSISSAQELQDLIDKVEDDTVSRTRAQTEELLTLTSAALALSADDMIKIHSLPDSDQTPEILDEIVAEEQASIQAAVDNLPALSATEVSKPLGQGSATAQSLNFDHLVDLRRRHQTIQAARGVRTRTVDSGNAQKEKEQSLRQQLIRKFHEALKEDSEQGKATGTGLERAARWRASAPGGRGGNVPGSQPNRSVAGNSQNAAATATALAKKARQSSKFPFSSCPYAHPLLIQAAIKRKDIFTKANVPNLPDIIAARVTMLRPICIGDYGVILTARGLMVGHIFGIHSKGGGKYGKHEPVTDSSNISALSKISVQVFENLHGAQFRSIPLATAVVQTKQFAHIPPIQFLCLLSAPARLIPTGIELTQEDAARFKSLTGGLGKFNEAMKLFRKRGKKKAAAGGESGDDDGEDSE
ncbi:hypothetical protein K438DRAFT_1962263 [Mycena galopus ATCC 62051]|nr:hypothetical protein K438DRAFT_1962263 [Mycena galopus ATCC 62051]